MPTRKRASVGSIRRLSGNAWAPPPSWRTSLAREWGRLTATNHPADRCLEMIKAKPPAKTNDRERRAAQAQSTKQIAANAVHGGPKDPKKDKRMGVGRRSKG